MRWASWAGWWSSMVLSLAAGPASAAEVEWDAPAVCPDGVELRFRIERAIGMPLSHAAALRFAIEAERSTEGYAARMDVDAGPAEPVRQRALVAPDCSQLTDLVAVTVAIALGADQVEDGVSPGDGSAPASPAPASAALAAPELTRSEERSARAVAANAEAMSEDGLAGSLGSPLPWSPELALWLLVDAGSLPRAGTGVALGGGLGHGLLRMRALGTWLFEEEAGLGASDAGGPGARLALVAGALSACAAPVGVDGSGWVVDGCAGWELGRLSGEGTGVLRPRSGAALWSAPRLDVSARWGLGATGLELGALLTLAVPLAREDFVLGDLGSVHRASAAVGRAALGLNWRLE